MRKRPSWPSPAMIVALIALFTSMGGVGYAVARIGTDDIKNLAVTSKKLHKGSVSRNKVERHAINSRKIARGSVERNKVEREAINAAKIADGQVRAAELGQLVEASAEKFIPANSVGGTTASCPDGTRLISGGGFSSLTTMVLAASQADGNGWRVDGRNEGTTGGTLTVYAYCLAR